MTVRSNLAMWIGATGRATLLSAANFGHTYRKSVYIKNIRTSSENDHYAFKTIPLEINFEVNQINNFKKLNSITIMFNAWKPIRLHSQYYLFKKELVNVHILHKNERAYLVVNFNLLVVNEKHIFHITIETLSIHIKCRYHVA